MTKETFHAKIMEEEKKLAGLEADLKVASEVIKKYGTDQEGLGMYNSQARDISHQKWVLSILKEADALYVHPVPSQKPPVTPEETFD